MKIKKATLGETYDFRVLWVNYLNFVRDFRVIDFYSDHYQKPNVRFIHRTLMSRLNGCNSDFPGKKTPLLDTVSKRDLISLHLEAYLITTH